MKKKLKSYKVVCEEMPANAAGHGNIASIGVGPDGEPGFTKKNRKKHKKSAMIRRIGKVG